MNNTNRNIPPDNICWKRMSFKGNKVWAPYDRQDILMVKNGKVRIKYNLKQNHEYWIKKESLKPEDQAVPAGARPRRKKAPAPVIPPNAVCIFTDGASSGNPGPSGIGVLMLYRDNRKEISEFIGTATNNIAELKAIHRALIALKRRDLPVKIFSDSTYAIEQLSGKNKPKANRELVLTIRTLMERFSDIDLVKVKAHSGVKENEVADFLAVSAVKKGTTQKGLS